MDLGSNEQEYLRAWEAPIAEAAHRAALDQLLAEWEERMAEAPPVRCPRCGRMVGEHRSSCDLAWLRLGADPAARQDPTGADQ